MALLRLIVTIILHKINEDNLNEQDDYGVPFSEQQFMHGSCYISLFKVIGIRPLAPVQNSVSLKHSPNDLILYSLKLVLAIGETYQCQPPK